MRSNEGFLWWMQVNPSIGLITENVLRNESFMLSNVPFHVGKAYHRHYRKDVQMLVWFVAVLINQEDQNHIFGGDKSFPTRDDVCTYNSVWRLRRAYAVHAFRLERLSNIYRIYCILKKVEVMGVLSHVQRKLCWWKKKMFLLIVRCKED